MAENFKKSDDGSKSEENTESDGNENVKSSNLNNNSDLDFRQNNPFSFKHFLQSDSLGINSSNSNPNGVLVNGTSNNNNNNINHSQSTSNINGNNESSPVNGNSSSPAKSATTSSLHNSSVTGARPKIPQFQSVNVINNVESKMKRSPRFSSFDSQSSLSDLADEKSSMNNLLQSSKSNNSFNLDLNYPSSASINPKSSQNVQRSYSHYDIESPIEGNIILDRKPYQPRNYNRGSQPNNNTSSNSTILPDFVQDHLLMEWYNSKDSPSKNLSPLSAEFDNFNEFNINGDDNDRNSSHMKKFPDDIPFDLTFNQGQASTSQGRCRTPNNRRNYPPIPLDLPNIQADDQLMNSMQQRPNVDLPPDLTAKSNGSNNNLNNILDGQAYGPHNEPEITRDQASIDKMQTLPDFLSDGPIHSTGRLADVATVAANDDSQSIIIRLQQENDRLRRELDERRSAMLEQNRRISELEKQINNAKDLEAEYNVSLAKSMEQVEDNLNASNKRAAESQSQVNKLKQLVKKLTTDVENLQRENESLREGGAYGGASTSSRSQQISRELRLAAVTAENNLRQLLAGVDNLRQIASTLENMDSIYDPANVCYLSDSEDDFNEGPAL